MTGISDEAIGRGINLTRIDILRVTDGMQTEYWVNSDTLPLMRQLSPARPMSIAGEASSP
jgi:hypothetical protein